MGGGQPIQAGELDVIVLRSTSLRSEIRPPLLGIPPLEEKLEAIAFCRHLSQA